MMQRSPLAATGRLTFGDLVRFQYIHFAGRNWIVPVGLSLLTLVSTMGLVATATSGDVNTMKNPGLFWMIGFAWSGLLCVRPYWTARRQYAKLPYLRKPLQYRFTAERIHQEGTSHQGEIAWSLVHAIYEARTIYMIYLNPQFAWVLPKRFFAGGRNDLIAWESMVRGRLKDPRRFRETGVIGDLI